MFTSFWIWGYIWSNLRRAFWNGLNHQLLGIVYLYLYLSQYFINCVVLSFACSMSLESSNTSRKFPRHTWIPNTRHNSYTWPKIHGELELFHLTYEWFLGPTLYPSLQKHHLNLSGVTLAHGWRARWTAQPPCRFTVWRRSLQTLDTRKTRGCVKLQRSIEDIFQGTNMSHTKSLLKMIFLFSRWDMLVPWRVTQTLRSYLQVIMYSMALVMSHELWSIPNFSVYSNDVRCLDSVHVCMMHCSFEELFACWCISTFSGKVNDVHDVSSKIINSSWFANWTDAITLNHH